jgi:hypothetical protein
LTVRDATPEEAKKCTQNLLQPLSDPHETYEHVLHQALEYYVHTRNYAPPILLNQDGDAVPFPWPEFFDEVVWPRREQERLAELSEKQHDRLIQQTTELEQKNTDPSTSGAGKERIESYLNRTQEHAEKVRESAAPEKQAEGTVTASEPAQPQSAVDKVVADARRQTPEQHQRERPLSTLEKILADARRPTPGKYGEDHQKQQELERQRQKDRDR